MGTAYGVNGRFCQERHGVIHKAGDGALHPRINFTSFQPPAADDGDAAKIGSTVSVDGLAYIDNALQAEASRQRPGAPRPRVRKSIGAGILGQRRSHLFVFPETAGWTRVRQG